MKSREAMLRICLIVILSLALTACQSSGGQSASAQNGSAETAASTEPQAGTTTDIPGQPSFADWLKELRKDALAAVVSPGTYNNAFATVQVNQEIVDKDREQSEFTKPIWSYLDSAVSPERIANGQIKASQYRPQLDAAAKRYGVPANI